MATVAENLFDGEDLLFKEPIGLFSAWFHDACRTMGSVDDAKAMCLSTATKDGKPSGRNVLMKSYGEDGFTFFTIYSSRKGHELEENPFAALTFKWGEAPLARQVRIEGPVKRVAPEVSDDYFNSIPRSSKIQLSLTAQNELITSRKALLDQQEELARKYADERIEIPRPGNWGGYAVIPEVIEFYQGRSNRINDRIRFRRNLDGQPKPDGILTHAGHNGWIYERLAP